MASETKTATSSARLSNWYRAAMAIVSAVLLLVLNITYTTWVDRKRSESEREADRRWCQLLTTLDQAYSTVPPTSELGRKVAAAIQNLRTELDC